MRELRRRHLAGVVWIPLRAMQTLANIGQPGYAGHKSEFVGVGTLAVPLRSRATAERLGWMDVGISHDHTGYVDDDKYVPADVYNDRELSGIHLALNQRGNTAEPSEWHLGQDLAVTLGLRREGDTWVRPDEDYIEVARLSREEDGSPCLLEIRASHLRDYLCARDMALYVTSYRSRVEVSGAKANVTWPTNPLCETTGGDRWEGRVAEIHEGGMPYGQKVAVFHVARTDTAAGDDVPILGRPTEDNTSSESWTKEFSGERLWRIEGELWRNEWVEPASASPIVRGDRLEPTVRFIVDAEGRQEGREVLVRGRRWLWFRPQVILALVDRRGGSLDWYTRDTGEVRCSPDHRIRFGVNSLCLVNVYAKDIVLLPEWQQRIWAGHNVGPDGRVSEELLASQVEAKPAETQAPEAFLSDGLSQLNATAQKVFGISIVRKHDHLPSLIARAHRFRATSEQGLVALAKDLGRITADSFDAAAMQTLVGPPKGTTWRSLKSLENLLGSQIDPSRARALLSPLVGIYELRHLDAHLPSHQSADSFELAGVDRTAPLVRQGYQLLRACVNSIYGVCEALESLAPR